MSWASDGMVTTIMDAKTDPPARQADNGLNGAADEIFQLRCHSLPFSLVKQVTPLPARQERTII